MKTASLRTFLFHTGTLLAAVLPTAAFGAPAVGVLDDTHANVRAVIAVQQRVTPDLLKLEGILGTAVGVSDSEQPLLVIYVNRDSASKAALIQALPTKVGTTGVRIEQTDKFRALAGGPPGGGSGVSHTAIQSAPIQLGTSGGWRNDFANGYCCGGTLGSLIQVNGVQYILSNYHVLEADIV